MRDGCGFRGERRIAVNPDATELAELLAGANGENGKPPYVASSLLHAVMRPDGALVGTGLIRIEMLGGEAGWLTLPPTQAHLRDAEWPVAARRAVVERLIARIAAAGDELLRRVGSLEPLFDGHELNRMRDLIGTAARLLGRRPPRLSVPTGMLKALKPFGPLVGAGMGQPPNLGELISSADGVTFWADSDRAILELGYSPRSLDTGLRDTFAAEGRRLETA